MVTLTSGQEPPMPSLCAGWASVQKASASGGFSLAFSHQQSLAECLDHLQSQGCVVEHIWHSELASKGSRSAGVMLLVFLGSVKEYYIFLVFLDPTCAFTSSDAHFAIRILKCASPSSTAPKTAKAFTLVFFLKRNSLFDFLLSLLLLAFPGCFSFHYHSMGVNFSGAQNRIRMQLCVVLALVMQSSCFCQQFFFYSIFHQPWLLLQIWSQLENNYFSIARA